MSEGEKQICYFQNNYPDLALKTFLKKIMASQSSPVTTPTRKISPPEPFKQNTPPPPSPDTKSTEVEPITPEQRAYLATAGPLTDIEKCIILKGTLTEEEKNFNENNGSRKSFNEWTIFVII